MLERKYNQFLLLALTVFGAVLFFSIRGYSQTVSSDGANNTEQPQAAAQTDASAQGVAAAVSNESSGKNVISQKISGADSSAAALSNKKITIDFKDADIKNVLKLLGYKAGVNIVPSAEVNGIVSVRLVDVYWEDALKTIISSYGYSYEQRGNIIMVAPVEKLTAMKKQEADLAQVQPVLTEVFHLKFIDAQDAKKAIESQLSSRGKVTALEMTTQPGWEFSKESFGKINRTIEERKGRSRVLIISDVPPVMDNIRKVITEIDIKPMQVLIETRIMEVSRDKLKDIGVDWGTGSTGAETATMITTPTSKKLGRVTSDLAGHVLGSQVSPAAFTPKATNISGVEPFNTGLEVLFQKLAGTQFEVMLHALEEDINTNTLSAPRIVALNNQEATILVGTKYTILKQDITGVGSGSTISITLDYYQNIGIQLNVIPQIGANKYINMVVHPAVSSFTQTLGTNNYPIIDTREAETRVLMKDGETVVIGGLLKDVKSKNMTGIPYLSKIPIIGMAFRRDTDDIAKIDLLIFITARIIEDGQTSEAEIAKWQETFKAAGDKKKKGKKKIKS